MSLYTDKLAAMIAETPVSCLASRRCDNNEDVCDVCRKSCQDNMRYAVIRNIKMAKQLLEYWGFDINEKESKNV